MMPKQFEHGVKWFTRATVRIPFPEAYVSCRYCPCLRSDAAGAQHKCCLNGAVLYNIDLLGEHCPIDYLEEDDHE